MLLSAPPAEYGVVSAGIDWLTCTAKNGGPSLALERVSDFHLDSLSESAEKPVRQSWLGFDGYKCEGLFFGRREHDVMLCLSGSLSHDLGRDAIAVASNVSRLDLQVTLFTMGEEVQLARDTWAHLKQVPKGNGRPRSFSMVIGHPVGQTLYLNSRASDNFGRLYDKGVESKISPAGMLWRYEVEFKREVARRESAGVALAEQLDTYCGDRVRSWYSERQVEPPFPTMGSLSYKCGRLQDSSHDVLTWFRNSLTRTVEKAIEKHGLNAVLESLGLQKHVTPIGVKTNGNLPAS